MSKIFIVLVVIFFVFGGIILYQFMSKPVPKTKLTINKHTFSVKTATTSAEQQQGLSGTKSLPKDQGVLFVFKTADKYPFWMKDMQFPIDIIFIRDKKVVQIISDVPVPKKDQTPQIYQPKAAADQVLEINAGLAKEYQFKTNDTVEIKTEK